MALKHPVGGAQNPAAPEVQFLGAMLTNKAQNPAFNGEGVFRPTFQVRWHVPSGRKLSPEQPPFIANIGDQRIEFQRPHIAARVVRSRYRGRRSGSPRRS